MRQMLKKIVKEKSEEIDKLLSDLMNEGPPERKPEDIFREKLEKQRLEMLPENIGDAIAYASITKIVGVDLKNYRPIYFEGSVDDAIRSG